MFLGVIIFDNQQTTSTAKSVGRHGKYVHMEMWVPNVRGPLSTSGEIKLIIISTSTDVKLCTYVLRTYCNYVHTALAYVYGLHVMIAKLICLKRYSIRK